MPLYPTIEDLKVDAILQSEQQNQPINANYPGNPSEVRYNQYPFASTNHVSNINQPISSIYPSINDYMGLDLSTAELEIIHRQQQQIANLALAQQSKNEVASFANKQVIAPLSGNSAGLKRAQVTNGVRELNLCKGKDSKIGMRCKAVNNGIFVVLVTENSPASLAGLRFGDQILQVNDTYVAGMSHEKLHQFIKKLPGDCITLSVRDRPLERTITLHKDNGNQAGFVFNNGKVTSIVKDSSAARNGLLTDSQILEIDGRNVVGFSDKKIKESIANNENTITLTVMPSILYDKIMSNMHSSLVKKLMDHTLFDY